MPVLIFMKGVAPFQEQTHAEQVQQTGATPAPCRLCTLFMNGLEEVQTLCGVMPVSCNLASTWTGFCKSCHHHEQGNAG